MLVILLKFGDLRCSNNSFEFLRIHIWFTPLLEWIEAWWSTWRNRQWIDVYMDFYASLESNKYMANRVRPPLDLFQRKWEQIKYNTIENHERKIIIWDSLIPHFKRKKRDFVMQMTAKPPRTVVFYWHESRLWVLNTPVNMTSITLMSWSYIVLTCKTTDIDPYLWI